MLPMFVPIVRSMMFDRPVILPHVQRAALVATAHLLAIQPL